MGEEHRPGQMQPNQLGQGEIRTSGPLTPVDINAGVGQNVTEGYAVQQQHLLSVIVSDRGKKHQRSVRVQLAP